jgi:uncharacterized protein (DUF433 family)
LIGREHRSRPLLLLVILRRGNRSAAKVPSRSAGYWPREESFSTIVFLCPKRKIKTNMGTTTSTLDWSQCSAVESIPGKRSGAWVFKGTRTPVSLVFENLQDMSVAELVDEFGVTQEQVQAVLQFAAHSTEAALHQ